MDFETSQMISPFLAKVFAAAAVAASIALTVLVAVIAMRRLDGNWDASAVMAAAGLGAVAVAALRRVLQAADSLLDRAHGGDDPGKPGGKDAP